MYELIVTNRGSSHSVFGETLARKDYPTIENGSTVYIPALEKMLIVTDEFIDVVTQKVLEVEAKEETVTPLAENITPPTEGDSNTGDPTDEVEDPAAGDGSGDDESSNEGTGSAESGEQVTDPETNGETEEQ